MYLWLVVTHDELELPLMVADSARQLGEMCGTSGNNVKSCVSKYEKGVLKWTKFRKVEITD